MDYSIKARSKASKNAFLEIKQAEITFGTNEAEAELLPNPTELFLGAFASCILKNVERFSGLLKFDYNEAYLEVNTTRLEHPPRLDKISYKVKIYSDDKGLNVALLKRNIEKFGTIYNTINSLCEVTGTVIKVNNNLGE